MQSMCVCVCVLKLKRERARESLQTTARTAQLNVRNISIAEIYYHFVCLFYLFSFVRLRRRQPNERNNGFVHFYVPLEIQQTQSNSIHLHWQPESEHIDE